VRDGFVVCVEKPEIPYRRVGAHRRLRVEEVLAYREQRAEKRREKLHELTRLSEEAEGGYR
jgi:hypothetical protein